MLWAFALPHPSGETKNHNKPLGGGFHIRPFFREHMECSHTAMPQTIKTAHLLIAGALNSVHFKLVGGGEFGIDVLKIVRVPICYR